MTKLIDGNPRWQDAEEVGLRFLQMHESNSVNKKVSMKACMASRELAFSCGTSACHAGWYGIYSDKDHVTYYTDGGDLMAEDLGFVGCEALIWWGLGNPKIWGSEADGNMFQDSYRFNKPLGHELTLKDISDHWLGVAKKLHKLQTGAVQ